MTVAIVDLVIRLEVTPGGRLVIEIDNPKVARGQERKRWPRFGGTR